MSSHFSFVLQHRSLATTLSNVSIPENEVKFRQFIRYFHDWVMGKVEGFKRYERMHFQPTTHSTCVGWEGEPYCVQPDFVGHTETLLEDIEFMMPKVPTLAATWNGELEKVNEAKRDRIAKGTIFKYPEELLMLCKVYWNDFQCGHYGEEIPRECVEENKRIWHQPGYCIDLNNVAVRWPDHRI